MYEIKHIDVWVTTRYATAFAFIATSLVSLLGFGFYLLDTLDRYGFASDYGYSRIDFEEVIPFIGGPLFAAFVAFCATALFCAIYNAVAERTSGLQVEMEFVPEDKAATSNDAEHRA